LDSLNQNFTIELWVNPHTTEKAILGKEIDSSDLHFSYWYYDGDQELFLNSTSYYIKGYSTIPTDTWTHIAVTRDGSQFQLYENGEAASTDLANSPGNADLSNNDESLYIGGTHINTSYCFQGYLDEIRIYNRTLSPSEIKKHSSPPPTGISFGTQE
ncbi:LamG domain-containing protein, partial [bacterium]|nr:LamG domain-containing protein [bacterium]